MYYIHFNFFVKAFIVCHLGMLQAINLIQNNFLTKQNRMCIQGAITEKVQNTSTVVKRYNLFKNTLLASFIRGNNLFFEIDACYLFSTVPPGE